MCADYWHHGVCVCVATEEVVGHMVTSKERNVLENLSSSYAAAKDALNCNYSIDEAQFQQGHSRLVLAVECPTGCDPPPPHC